MRQARILIVEDETDVLLVNSEYLREQGYEVRTADTVADAREALRDFPPDLILLDVLLPDGSGLDFCRELRTITDAPIVFLTCLDQRDSIINALSSGGDDYITKPYDLQVLGARIGARLRRTGVSNAPTIELPPLRIHLQHGRAYMRDRPLSMSQKELQLLAFLAGNAGCGYTADKLYEAVWGLPPINSTGTVKVHISMLRKKLRFDCEGYFEIRLTDNGYAFHRVIFGGEE